MRRCVRLYGSTLAGQPRFSAFAGGSHSGDGIIIYVAAQPRARFPVASAARARASSASARPTALAARWPVLFAVANAAGGKPGKRAAADADNLGAAYEDSLRAGKKEL